VSPFAGRLDDINEDGMRVVADIGTMPFAVLKQLFHHPLTEAGQKRFLEDYRKTQEAKPAAPMAGKPVTPEAATKR
ncbi:MAG: hypothetical protein ACRDF9_08405, partial [Candidatus Limnocylindria bacterium]